VTVVEHLAAYRDTTFAAALGGSAGLVTLNRRPADRQELWRIATAFD
jgi:hypothetical protein